MAALARGPVIPRDMHDSYSRRELRRAQLSLGPAASSRSGAGLSGVATTFGDFCRGRPKAHVRDDEKHGVTKRENFERKSASWPFEADAQIATKSHRKSTTPKSQKKRQLFWVKEGNGWP